jgi:hypothetical protein
MSEQNLESEQAFERRTKQLFDESVAGLDARTRSQLTRARHRALEELAPHKARGWRWSLVPAGGVAVAAVMAWLLVGQPPPTETAFQSASPADLDLLLGEADPEMLNEELEFYGWLEEQPEFAADGDSVG